MNAKLDFWFGITSNIIWIGLGVICFLSAAGLVSELATWWLFGIGLIVGGFMGLISMFQS
jgi:hypothetical protein